MDADGSLDDIRVSYDEVAASYADQQRDSLDGEPYLRAALALFAELIRDSGGGPVADLGCGPGHVTAHLQQLGVSAFGIDCCPSGRWSTPPMTSFPGSSPTSGGSCVPAASCCSASTPARDHG
jgi:hypothetical protein